jgi:hypothetical protein
MKRMMSMFAALLVLTLGSAPTQAQQASATLSFAITVAGTPCANATYFAVLAAPGSEFFAIQLTDADGDRVYTGSTTAGVGTTYRVQLVQGTGTIQSPTSSNPFPGTPSTVLKDFGDVALTANQTFAATAAGCSTLPPTGAETSLPLPLTTAALVVLATGLYLRRRMQHHLA